MSGSHRAAPAHRGSLAVVAIVLAVAAVGVAWILVRDRGGATQSGAALPAVSAQPTTLPSPSLRPVPSPSPSWSPRPPRSLAPKPEYAPTGHLDTVEGRSPAEGSGDPYRYRVQVESGLPIDGGEFAAQVQQVLTDARGWGGRFQRVPRGAVDFTVVLASADLTDALCAPLQTNGIYSCFMNGRAVLNYMRWHRGADAYGEDLERYRVYMINHEVGHALGHDHAACPASGRPAPIMMQQTKGVAPCRPNPWPAVSP